MALLLAKNHRHHQREKTKEKSLFFLPQLSQKFTFPPLTSKPDKPPPSTFQTVHFTSLERF
jgi:hypothetical protein